MLLICTPTIETGGSFVEAGSPQVSMGGSLLILTSRSVSVGGALTERAGVPAVAAGSMVEMAALSVTVGGSAIFVLAPDAALAAVFTALSMNAKTAGVALYSNFPLTSMFKLGLEYYGITADGLVHLAGNTDAGAQIDALIVSGVSDLGLTEKKNLSEAYLTMRCEGGLQLSVTYDERKAITQTRSSGKAGLSDIHFPLPLGAEGNQVQIAISNVDGADFDFKKVDITIVKRDRRR